MAGRGSVLSGVGVVDGVAVVDGAGVMESTLLACIFDSMYATVASTAHGTLLTLV